MGDAEQDVLDLPGAEVRVELAKRHRAAQSAVRLPEPRRGLLAAPENVLRLRGDPPDAEEPVGFVGLEAPGALPRRASVRGGTRRSAARSFLAMWNWETSASSEA